MSNGKYGNKGILCYIYLCQCDQDYIRQAIASDSTGRLKTEKDTKRLFRVFCRRYSHHDAEKVFPWASKYVKFDETRQQGEMSKGPYWIKGEPACSHASASFILILNIVYFINLAVKTKLHLDAPRAEHTDRQSLLDYYDLFPRLPKYGDIKPRHFKKKPLRFRTGRKRTCNEPTVEEVGDMGEITEDEDEIDVEEEDADANGGVVKGT